MNRLRWTIPTLALSAGLVVGGCGDKGGKDGGKAGQGAKGQAAGSKSTGGKAAVAETSIFTTAAVVQAIPASAEVVGVIASGNEIASQIGRDGLIKVFPEEYAQMRKEMSEIYGDRDILDPSGWAEIGLDATKPMAMAMIDADDEAIAFYLPLSDGAKFDAFVGPILDKAGAPKAEAGAKYRAMKAEEGEHVFNRAYLIRKGDLAITLYTRKPTEEARKIATELADLTPDKSIGAGGDAADAFKALAKGRHGALWVNIPALMAQEFDPDDHWGVMMAKEDLARAEADKDEARIQSAKSRLKSEREFAEMMRKRHEQEMKILSAAFKGINGFALGGTSAGPVLSFKGSLEMSKDAPIRALFAKGKGVPMLVRAMDTQPLFMGTGQLDVEGVEKYIEGLIAASGEKVNLAQAKGMLMAASGVNVDEFLGQIDGEVGFAFTFDNKALGSEEPQKGMGGAAVLRLKDPKKGLELVKGLMGNPMVKSMVKSSGEGMWEIPVPEYGPLYIGVVGDYLAASPDKGFLDRVKANDASKSFTHGIQSADLKALLNTPDVGQLWINDSMFFGYMMFARMGFWERPAPHTNNPPEGYAAKLKEYEAAQAALKAQTEKDEKAEFDEMGVIMKLVGTQAGYAMPGDRGLTLVGGQYLGAASLSETVVKIAKQAKLADQNQSARRRAREPLEEKMNKIYEELDQMVRGNMPQPMKGLPSQAPKVVHP